MAAIIKDLDGRYYYRLSRWIRIKCNTNISPRNDLLVYATDGSGRHPGETGFDATDGIYLDYFRWSGRNYAIEQFLRLDYPIMYHDHDGRCQYLAGYDCENYYNPILIEIDDGGEYVRVYQELTEMQLEMEKIAGRIK